MRKGGYLIVDLQDNDIITSTEIEGIYDVISNNYRKVVLLSGITIDSTVYNDVFTSVTLNASSKFEIVEYGYTITIDASDNVVAVLNE